MAIISGTTTAMAGNVLTSSTVNNAITAAPGGRVYLRPNGSANVTGSLTVNNAITAKNQLIRTKSRAQLAMIELSKLPGRKINDEVANYYKSVTGDQLIHHLGFIRPVFCGRPHTLAKKMLELAASDCGGAYYGSAGISYSIPFIPGIRKTRARLTMAGLQLLDHWAEKSPSFRPFLNAYVTKKARKEILADTVDFELGVIPQRIKVMLERQRKGFADLQQKELKKLDDYIRDKKTEWMNRQAEQNARRQYANMLQQPSWVSTNMQNAVNTYNGLTGAQGVGSSSNQLHLSHNPNQSVSTLYTYPDIGAIQAALPGMIVSYNHSSDTVSIADRYNGTTLRQYPADMFR